MVDLPKAEQIVSRIQRYRAVLARLAAVPAEAFLTDADKVGNAKYHFVVAIECCIDLANHLIASEGWRMPTSNADSFTVLGEAGAVPSDRVERWRAMARFRNRLVHLYWDVDDAEVARYLADGLGDLDAYTAAIARWISSHAATS